MIERPDDLPSRASLEPLTVQGTFEDALGALETVTEHLERGRLTVEESVAWYELGLELSRRCAELLRNAELRVSTIEDRYELDSPQTVLWGNDDD